MLGRKILKLLFRGYDFSCVNFWRKKIRKIVIFLLSFFLTTFYSIKSFSNIKNSEPINKNVVMLEELVTKNCNEKQTIYALADLVFGEANTLKVEERLDVVRFVVSEAIRNNRSICEEKIAKAGSKPTSAYRYTSVYTVESKKQKWAKSYIQQVKWVKSIFRKNIKIVEYNHYITVDLAVRRPPDWFKFYIKDYSVTGAHVFVLLDFKDKQVEGYNKLMNDLMG